MKSAKLILAVSLAVLGTAALADPGTPGKGLERFKAADTNADGMISREEARVALPKIYEHFDRIDANKDGQITFEELRASHQHALGARLKKADTDGDGKLSRAEVAQMPRLAAHFDEIDTNKDGYLSKEELQAAHAAHAKAK
jgi:Ca2+-binding EF-hand superfamily protein